jgi:hypothetical protein
MDMPIDLNEIYERILKRCQSVSYRKYMKRALRWLCFSTRPLSLAELSEAVVVEKDDTDLDSNNRLREPEFLLALGQGIFDYDSKTKIVTLGHSSVKPFLTTPEWIQKSEVAEFELNEQEAHHEIMSTCLTYLMFKPFGIGAHGARQDYVRHAQEYPLLRYASPNWPIHARGVDEHNWEVIERSFSTRNLPTGGNYAYWVRHIAKGGSAPALPTIKATSPLYYAASFGYTALVSAIIRFVGTLNLEQPGGRVGSTALQVACFRKQRDPTILLVKAGANPFSLDASGCGFSSVFWATANGWDDVVELMQEYGSRLGFKIPNQRSTQEDRQLAQETQGHVLAAESGPMADRSK